MPAGHKEIFNYFAQRKTSLNFSEMNFPWKVDSHENQKLRKKIGIMRKNPDNLQTSETRGFGGIEQAIPASNKIMGRKIQDGLNVLKNGESHNSSRFPQPLDVTLASKPKNLITLAPSKDYYNIPFLKPNTQSTNSEIQQLEFETKSGNDKNAGTTRKLNQIQITVHKLQNVALAQNTGQKLKLKRQISRSFEKNPSRGRERQKYLNSSKEFQQNQTQSQAKIESDGKATDGSRSKLLKSANQLINVGSEHPKPRSRIIQKEQRNLVLKSRSSSITPENTSIKFVNSKLDKNAKNSSKLNQTTGTDQAQGDTTETKTDVITQRPSQECQNLMRKSITEHSQEKTLKLQYMDQEKKVMEQKKKMLEEFNKTIRKKNKLAKSSKRPQQQKLYSTAVEEQRSQQVKQSQQPEEKLKQLFPEAVQKQKKAGEQERRKQMGLEFLNKMSGSNLSKMLQAQKVKKDFVAADQNSNGGLSDQDLQKAKAEQKRLEGHTPEPRPKFNSNLTRQKRVFQKSSQVPKEGPFKYELESPNPPEQKYYISQSTNEPRRRNQIQKNQQSRSRNLSRSKDYSRQKQSFQNNQNAYSHTDYTNQLKHSLDIDSKLIQENLKRLEQSTSMIALGVKSEGRVKKIANDLFQHLKESWSSKRKRPKSRKSGSSYEILEKLDSNIQELYAEHSAPNSSSGYKREPAPKMMENEELMYQNYKALLGNSKDNFLKNLSKRPKNNADFVNIGLRLSTHKKSDKEFSVKQNIIKMFSQQRHEDSIKIKNKNSEVFASKTENLSSKKQQIRKYLGKNMVSGGIRKSVDIDRMFPSTKTNTKLLEKLIKGSKLKTAFGQQNLDLNQSKVAKSNAKSSKNLKPVSQESQGHLLLQMLNTSKSKNTDEIKATKRTKKGKKKQKSIQPHQAMTKQRHLLQTREQDLINHEILLPYLSDSDYQINTLGSKEFHKEANVSSYSKILTTGDVDNLDAMKKKPNHSVVQGQNNTLKLRLDQQKAEKTDGTNYDMKSPKFPEKNQNRDSKKDSKNQKKSEKKADNVHYSSSSSDEDDERYNSLLNQSSQMRNVNSKKSRPSHVQTNTQNNPSSKNSSFNKDFHYLNPYSRPQADASRKSSDQEGLSKSDLDQWTEILSELRNIKSEKIGEKLREKIEKFCARTENNIQKMVEGKTTQLPILDKLKKENEDGNQDATDREKKISPMNKKKKLLAIDTDKINEEYTLSNGVVIHSENSVKARHSLSQNPGGGNQYLITNNSNNGNVSSTPKQDEEKLPNKIIAAKMHDKLDSNHTGGFEWLRKEFLQNIDSYKMVLMSNPKLKKDLQLNTELSVEQMQNVLEKNLAMSHIFEVRENALTARYKVKLQMLEELDSQKEPLKSQSSKNLRQLKSQLDSWYTEEMQILDQEKKNITKGWLTSIDAIRKIRKDLEVAAKVKQDDGFRKRILLGEDLNIFSMLNLNNRSQQSPQSIYSGSNVSAGLIRNSPAAISGNNPGLKINAGFSKNLGLISDPNVQQLNRSKKLKTDLKINRGLMDEEKNQPLKDNHQHSNKHLAANQMETAGNTINQSTKSPSIPMPVSESQEISNTYKQNLNSLQSTLKWRSPFGSPPARANAHASDNSSALYRLSPTSMKQRPHNSIWEDEDEVIESENQKNYPQEIEGKKSKTCEIDIGRIKGNKSDPLYVIEDEVDINEIAELEENLNNTGNNFAYNSSFEKKEPKFSQQIKNISRDQQKRTLNIQDEYVYENSVSDQGHILNSTSRDPLSASRITRDLIANKNSASLDRLSKHLQDNTTSSHGFEDEDEIPQSGGELDSDMDLDDSMQGLRGQARKRLHANDKIHDRKELENTYSVELGYENERFTGTEEPTKDIYLPQDSNSFSTGRLSENIGFESPNKSSQFNETKHLLEMENKFRPQKKSSTVELAERDFPKSIQSKSKESLHRRDDRDFAIDIENAADTNRNQLVFEKLTQEHKESEENDLLGRTLDDENPLELEDEKGIESLREARGKSKLLLDTDFQQESNPVVLQQMTPNQLYNFDEDPLARHQLGFDEFGSLSNNEHDLNNISTPASKFNTVKNFQPFLKLKAETNLKCNILSNQILNLLFEEVIDDIISLLENDNNMIEDQPFSGEHQHYSDAWRKNQGISDIDRNQILVLDHNTVQPGRNNQGRIKSSQIYQGFSMDEDIEDGQLNEPHEPFSQDGIVGDLTRRGIRVNFNSVKEYMSMLTNYVKGVQEDEKSQIIFRLDKPYGLTYQEKMAVFHEGSGENDGVLSSARLCQRAALNFEIYLRLEEDLTLRGNSDDKFKQELEHIHNKMLFDAYNEAIDYQRPYDLKGTPFPWRANAGRLITKPIMSEQLPLILDRAQERVLDWAMFMCGFIPDKEDSMIGEIVIDDDYLNQIKEDRLIKMLTCEAFETDERWLLYDDEEVEVQTEVSELVFNQLLEETIRDLIRMRSITKKNLTAKSGSINRNSERRAPTDSSNPFFEERSNMVEELILDADFGTRSELIDGFKMNQSDTPRSTKSYNSQIQPRPSRDTHKHELSNRSRFSNHAFPQEIENSEDKFAKNKSDLVKKRVVFNSRGSDRISKDRPFGDEVKEQFDTTQVRTIDSFEPELSPNLNNTPIKQGGNIDMFENFEDLKNEDFSNLKNDREKIMQSSEQNSPTKSESEGPLSSEMSEQESYEDSEDISDSLFPIGPPITPPKASNFENLGEKNNKEDVVPVKDESGLPCDRAEHKTQEILVANDLQNLGTEDDGQLSLISDQNQDFEKISGKSFPNEPSQLSNLQQISQKPEGQMISLLNDNNQQIKNNLGIFSEENQLELYDNPILVTQSSNQSAQKPISNIDDFFSKNSQDSMSKNFQDEEEQHLNISDVDILAESDGQEVKKSMPNLHKIERSNFLDHSPETLKDGKLGGALMEQLKLSHENAAEDTAKKTQEIKSVSNLIFFQAAGDLELQNSKDSTERLNEDLSNIESDSKIAHSQNQPLDTVGTDDFGDIDFVDDEFGAIDEDPFNSKDAKVAPQISNEFSSHVEHESDKKKLNQDQSQEKTGFEKDFEEFEFGQNQESNPQTETSERKFDEADFDFNEDFDDFDF